MRKSVAEILGKIKDGTVILVDKVRPGAWPSVSATATIGMVLASTAASPQALARGVETSGRGLLADLSDDMAATAMQDRAREIAVAINALLGPVADPEAIVATVDWKEQVRLARAEDPSPEDQERMLRGHGQTFRDLLGPASLALAHPGPLASDRNAAAVAAEVERELDMGSVPTGLSADHGKVALALEHRDTDANLVLAMKTDGPHAGSAMRYADGKLADFGPDRPAMRAADGTERHVAAEGVDLPATWAADDSLTPDAPTFRA